MGLKTLAFASQNKFLNKYSVPFNEKVLRYYSLAFVSIVMISTYVAAEEYRSELEALFFLEGQCTEVIVYNQKSSCAGMVWQSQYTDGKLGFYFFFGDADTTPITFSGWGFEQKHINENRVEQPIERVIMPNEIIPVNGSCIYENPYIGHASIQCKAEDGLKNVFEARFLTDGKPPVIRHFDN